MGVGCLHTATYKVHQTAGHYWELGPAGVLATMLQRRIALTDIDKWFYKPTHQDLAVHQELSHMLSQHGLSWPPMLESMSSCAAYSLSSRASASGEPIARS